MKIIGLTGGIASGKSTVSAYLASLGAGIIDADKIAHELSRPQAAIWLAYRDLLGEQAFSPDGTLDRVAIGRLVFGDAALRRRVDERLHPIIRREVQSRLSECAGQGIACAVLDVPLLFEAGWEEMADETWLVYVPHKVQLYRLRRREHCNRARAEQKIASQMDLDRKRELADVIIDNSGPWEETRRQVEAAWRSVGE